VGGVPSGGTTTESLLRRKSSKQWMSKAGGVPELQGDDGAPILGVPLRAGLLDQVDTAVGRENLEPSGDPRMTAELRQQASTGNDRNEAYEDRSRSTRRTTRKRSSKCGSRWGGYSQVYASPRCGTNGIGWYSIKKKYRQKAVLMNSGQRA